MPYDAEISRANPTCIIFLLDQSASMDEPIGGNPRLIKCVAVAEAINRLLSELSIKCAKEEGVRDYFHVAVLGYGESVHPVLGGPLEGRDLVPLSEIAAAPIRLEARSRKIADRSGGRVTQQVKFPIWVDPMAEGGTPMAGALRKAHDLIAGWLATHPDCFPPMVLNLTDGESTDGDPAIPATSIHLLSSSDGAVLLFNLHVSARVSPPITFPDAAVPLPNNFARCAVRHVERAARPHARLRAGPGLQGPTRRARLRVQLGRHLARPIPRHRDARASDLR